MFEQRLNCFCNSVPPAIPRLPRRLVDATYRKSHFARIH